MAKQSDSAPEFVRYVGPVLDALTALGGSGGPDEVRSAIAKAMNISEEEQAQPLPSGVQSRFENQVHWARFYLAKDGYIDASKHGVWTLTEKARVLGKISAAKAREIYRAVATEFRKSQAPEEVSGADEQVAPTTDVDHPFVNYRQTVGARLQALPAAGFERFCQRLLRESGFEEVSITGRSGRRRHRWYRASSSEPAGELQGAISMQAVHWLGHSQSGSRLQRCDDGPSRQGHHHHYGLIHIRCSEGSRAGRSSSD